MQSAGKHGADAESLITTLYERYAAVILYSIRRQLPSNEDAEDILLDVFVAAFESDTFPRLEEKAQLAWLRRVAQNKCVDYFRRAYRRPAVSLEQSDLHASLYDDEQRAPEQVALLNEEYRLLYQQLDSLPVRQQEVLHLRFGEDMRCVDIARKLQLREGTVRGWLSRALNQLRTIYANSKKEMP